MKSFIKNTCEFFSFPFNLLSAKRLLESSIPTSVLVDISHANLQSYHIVTRTSTMLKIILSFLHVPRSPLLSLSLDCVIIMLTKSL